MVLSLHANHPRHNVDCMKLPGHLHAEMRPNFLHLASVRAIRL